MLRRMDDVPEMKKPAKPRREAGKKQKAAAAVRTLRLLLYCVWMRGKIRPDGMQNRNSEVRRNEERETV